MDERSLERHLLECMSSLSKGNEPCIVPFLTYWNNEMKTLHQLVAAVNVGARPHVTFTPKIEQLEGYPEGGMKAAILSAGAEADGVVWLRVDYAPYREHNLPLEKSNYWDGSGRASLTCTEAGYYEPVENLYFMGDNRVSDYMIEGTNELFTEFMTDQGAGYTTASTYVEWLEEQVRKHKTMRGLVA